MELYLLRHGVAVDRLPDDSGDFHRALTAQGISKMEKAARGLRQMRLALDILWSSPLTRAKQTAEIVGKELRINVTQIDLLQPGCEAALLLSLLQQHRSAERVMIVGHEPDFSQMTAELTGGSLVEFKKGGLAMIRFEGLRLGAGQLCWLLPPWLLRELAH
jgi:phosphohistidine phosphatase